MEDRVPDELGAGQFLRQPLSWKTVSLEEHPLTAAQIRRLVQDAVGSNTYVDTVQFRDGQAVAIGQTNATVQSKRLRVTPHVKGDPFFYMDGTQYRQVVVSSADVGVPFEHRFQVYEGGPQAVHELADRLRHTFESRLSTRNFDDYSPDLDVRNGRSSRR